MNTIINVFSQYFLFYKFVANEGTRVIRILNYLMYILISLHFTFIYEGLLQCILALSFLTKSVELQNI
jgi:hypothetical protein